MNAVEEFRSLLDERGVEWCEPTIKPNTTWFPDSFGVNCRVAPWGELLQVKRFGLTPEQAIAATLGGGEEFDVDRAYVERIKPRLIEGTPTEDIRRWSALAHSVMEVAGPSPFGMDGSVFLWLHESSLMQLLDMCDAVDAKFSEAEKAATVGSEINGVECERVKHGTKPDGTPRWRCSICDYGLGDDRWSYCPKCGAKIRKAVKR